MSEDQKKYKVVVHDDAAAMLYSHVRFLANVSASAARKLRTMLWDAFASLESFPYRCPVYASRRTRKAYRQLIIGRYKVIFSISEEESAVYVHYILDSRQDHDF